ncbi:phosphatidylserine decarboxylase family protein [Blattabacterium cuenoti]|uniref:phosphatidylserine decarboxylase family protein n=1 Tax=Blattabacterium cuenoti TaxID=1653831 RepID=UPI00293BAE7F|nr:phosphatidylserine decarboxylase family protein [Blattabacterium cuenoti]
MLIILILLIILFFFLFSSRLLHFLFSIFLITFYVFFIFFFRNPKIDLKEINKKEYTKLVVSPANGKIIEIKKVFENEFLNKNCICISIFMSPLDIHVNRYPISGKVVYAKYHIGKYMIAWLKKSSLNNEHTTVVIRTKTGENILFRQIAGFIARRIVLYSKINDVAKKGEEFGFIKFGSRVDIFIPNTSIIKVKKGEKVIGGITIISILP